MASILYISTFGSDDPTRASLPFVIALGAVEAGHSAQVVLLGESGYIMKDFIADQMYGVGVPPLKELLQKAIAQNIPIHV